jgi:hypothetical protein
MTDCTAYKRHEVQDEITACKAAIPEQIGNYARRAECMRSAVVQYFPDDMASQVGANSAVVIGHRIDVGEITPDEGKLQLSEILMSLQERVSASEAQAANARTSALLGAASIIQNQQMVNRLNQPVVTNCSAMGGMTNCVSK